MPLPEHVISLLRRHFVKGDSAASMQVSFSVNNSYARLMAPSITKQNYIKVRGCG